MATLRDMENTARMMDPGLNGDFGIGNVIDITDSSDTLGLNLLSNQSNTMYGSSQQQQQPQTINVNIPSQSMSSGFEINAEQLEPINMISMDASNIPVDIQFSREQPSNNANTNNPFNNNQTATGPSVSFTPAPPQRDIEKDKKEKNEYLTKLARLEKRGYPVSKKFSVDNSLDEVKEEYERLVDARNLEGSLRFQRQTLMSVVSGLEWMNNKFDPIDAHLDGWSESVHENVDDFDEIFEELYDKYKDRGNMPPEVRLMFALAGSGFMCHVSNTFLREKMPNMDAVLRNNPELAKQLATATAQEAGPGFGNMMGMAMGVPQQPPQGFAPPQGYSPPNQQRAPTGAFFGSSAQQQQQQNQMPNPPQHIASVEPPTRATARREMKGPSGVDDILKTFEEQRRAEVMGNMGMGIEGAISHFSNPNAMNQPATAAVMEMESVGSNDIGGSVAESSSKRGRRRKAVGNTLSLNV